MYININVIKQRRDALQTSLRCQKTLSTLTASLSISILKNDGSLLIDKNGFMQKEVTNKNIFAYLQKIDKKVTKIEGNMVTREEFREIEKEFKEQQKILHQHTDLLNQHTDLLNQHTGLLNQHSGLLMEQQETTQGIIEYLQEQVPTKEEMAASLGKQKHELMNFVEERLDEKVGELRTELKIDIGNVRKDLKETKNELMGMTTRLVHVLENKDVLNKKEVKKILPVGSFA